jgi:hypothetical protein
MADIAKIMGAISDVEQALLELTHAIDVGPEWFTNGRRGQIQQATLWNQRAAAALKVIRSGLTEAEGGVE